jgi:hypothetical protein
MKPSRFEPMNRMTCEVFSLAPIGGEGWGEGAIRSALRFMERGKPAPPQTSPSRWTGYIFT